jgi:RNA polymerase sigma factor (sigma-70 family)
MHTAANDPFGLPPDDESALLSLLQQVHELRSQLESPDELISPRQTDLSATQRAILVREQAAIEIVYGYLRRALPGLMCRLFGPEVLSQREDATVRFTEMLHNFLLKILEKRPDELWRAQTARQFRQWASVANANLMRDVLRRERRGDEILKEQLAPLLSARSQHFEKTAHRPLDETVLEQIESWIGSDLEVNRQMGLVLRYRYLDGLPYREIAHMLGIAEATVHKRRQAALEWLRVHRC